MKRRSSVTTDDAPTGDLFCACASARRVARMVTQLYDQHLRSAGIESPQFALLMALQNDGPSSQIALSRRYGLDKTTMSRNLRWLERRGWIASIAAPDARLRHFTLTADGRKQVKMAMPLWKDAQAELRSQMGANNWDGMFRAFQSLTHAAHAVRAGKWRHPSS